MGYLNKFIDKIRHYVLSDLKIRFITRMKRAMGRENKKAHFFLINIAIFNGSSDFTNVIGSYFRRVFPNFRFEQALSIETMSFHSIPIGGAPDGWVGSASPSRSL